MIKLILSGKEMEYIYDAKICMYLKYAVHGVAEGRTRLSDFTFTFHFHALEKEMATCREPARDTFSLPSGFLSMRVFSNEWALCIRWPKYWSFSFSISPSMNIQGLAMKLKDSYSLEGKL